MKVRLEMGAKTTKQSTEDANYHAKLTNIVEAIQRNEANNLKALLEDQELTSNSFEDIIHLLENSDQPLLFKGLDVISLLVNDKRLTSSLFKDLTTLIENNCNNNAEVLENISAHEKAIDYYGLFNQQIHQYVVIEKPKDKAKSYSNKIDYNKFKCIYNIQEYDDSPLFHSTSIFDYLIKHNLFNRKEGTKLTLDDQNATPIGYNIHLPSGPPKAIMVRVYGGIQNKDKDNNVNTPLSINDLDYYLLNKGIAVVKLNLPDLLDLEVFQGKMPEDLFIKIQNCINKFYQQLSNNPEELHKDLSQLRGLKSYLYGASFGGLVSIKHSELFPNNFDGYISHDGAISIQMMHKADVRDLIREDQLENLKKKVHSIQKRIDGVTDERKNVYESTFKLRDEIVEFIETIQNKRESSLFNDYLDPAKQSEINKIIKPVFVLQNQDDNNVHAKVAIDFYKKMQEAGKTELIKLLMTKTSNPATKEDPENKGHFIPENENDFITYCEGILNFMLSSPELSEVNKLEAYRLKKQTNKYYRKATIQQEFIAQALDKFEKSLSPYKNFDLPKLTEIVNEYFQSHWESEYQPLYYALHYSTQLTDGHHDNALKDELTRLADIMTDEMIVKVLKSQENIFHQFLDEFMQFKTPSTVTLSDLSTSPQIVQKYREMLKNAGTDLKTARYFLSTLYKTNPDILSQPYYVELFSKDVNLQHELQKANVKLVKITHKMRSDLVMLNFMNKLVQVEKSNDWSEKNIKQLQSHFKEIKEHLSNENKLELNNHIYLQLKELTSKNPINMKTIATLLSFAKETKGFKGIFNFTMIETLKSKLTFNDFNVTDIEQYIKGTPNNNAAFKTEQGIWDYDGTMLENARKAYVFCDIAYTDLLMEMDTWSKNYNHILADFGDVITSDESNFIKKQVKLREEALIQQLKNIESLKETYRDNIVNAYKVENPNLKPESEKRINDTITSWEKELKAPQRTRNIKEHFNAIYPQRASAMKENIPPTLLYSKGISDKKAQLKPGQPSNEKNKKQKKKLY